MASSTLLFATCLVIFCVQISHAYIGDNCVGGQCPNNEQDAYCPSQSGKCSCPNDRIVSTDRMRCLPLAQSLGAGCEISAQCTQLGNAECNLDRMQCSCKVGSTVVGSTCKQKQYLNDQCTNSQECSHIPFGICSVNNGICTCDQQHVPSPTNTSACLPLAVTWMAPCQESIQCQAVFGDNAICKDMSKCACKEGFHPGSSPPDGTGVVSPVKTTCVVDKGLSMRCDRNDECFLPLDADNQNIFCEQNVCKCRDNRVPSKDNRSCNGAGTMAVFSLFWAVVLALTASRA